MWLLDRYPSKFKYYVYFSFLETGCCSFNCKCILTQYKEIITASLPKTWSIMMLAPIMLVLLSVKARPLASVTCICRGKVKKMLPCTSFNIFFFHIRYNRPCHAIDCFILCMALPPIRSQALTIVPKKIMKFIPATLQWYAYYYIIYQVAYFHHYDLFWICRPKYWSDFRKIHVINSS